MPHFNKVENGFFVINEKSKERRDNAEKVPELESENANLWYESMLNKTLTEEHTDDIVNIWYELMLNKGGV